MPQKGWTRNVSTDDFLRTAGILRARQVGLYRGAVILQSVWKEVLSEPGRGRMYRANTSRPHRASAPGDPPAPDRGLLRASVNIDPPATRQIKGRVRVGMGGPRGMIGLALEKGTPTIKPRPHARPAGERAKPALTKGIVIAMRKSMKDVPLG